VLNATQVAESAALTQVRGIFDITKWLAFTDNGASSTQAVINNMTAAAEQHLMRQHSSLARSWTPQRCKAWMLADFRPVQTSSSSSHAKLAWFHPDNTIQSMDALTLAVAVWAHLETEMRGRHMRIIWSAMQSLVILDARKGHRLGWRNMMYIMEARAMQLRYKASPDTPTQRATLAFTISAEDDDVKLCLDNPVNTAPTQTARTPRFDPHHGPTPRARGDARARPTTNAHISIVPPRLRELENVCYEWAKAGMNPIDCSHQCPRVLAGAATCNWEHAIPHGTPQYIAHDFKDWCQLRGTKATARPTGAQRRSRKRAADE
jgi:hypothetical protein